MFFPLLLSPAFASSAACREGTGIFEKDSFIDRRRAMSLLTSQQQTASQVALFMHNRLTDTASSPASFSPSAEAESRTCARGSLGDPPQQRGENCEESEALLKSEARERLTPSGELWGVEGRRAFLAAIAVLTPRKRLAIPAEEESSADTALDRRNSLEAEAASRELLFQSGKEASGERGRDFAQKSELAECREVTSSSRIALRNQDLSFRFYFQKEKKRSQSCFPFAWSSNATRRGTALRQRRKSCAFLRNFQQDGFEDFFPLLVEGLSWFTHRSPVDSLASTLHACTETSLAVCGLESAHTGFDFDKR